MFCLFHKGVIFIEIFLFSVDLEYVKIQILVPVLEGKLRLKYFMKNTKFVLSEMFKQVCIILSALLIIKDKRIIFGNKMVLV